MKFKKSLLKLILFVFLLTIVAETNLAAELEKSPSSWESIFEFLKKLSEIQFIVWLIVAFLFYFLVKIALMTAVTTGIKEGFEIITKTEEFKKSLNTAISELDLKNKTSDFVKGILQHVEDCAQGIIKAIEKKELKISPEKVTHETTPQTIYHIDQIKDKELIEELIRINLLRKSNKNKEAIDICNQLLKKDWKDREKSLILLKLGISILKNTLFKNNNQNEI